MTYALPMSLVQCWWNKHNI